jgi:6-phospho-beta-glucosidase
MVNPIKVCVIGAGSSYTPELMEGLIEKSDELPVAELALMDIDRRKLEIVGGLARRMVAASGREMSVSLTLNRREALAGAQYVISQIRVGGMEARILDEKIPPRFGVIGQETTGPGGFAKALRTIPVALSIARDMEELAPGAFLLNFTNPAGLITEALSRYSNVPTIGLCNLPIGVEMRQAKAFGVDRSQVRLDWVGLNHLNWVRGVSIDGEDVWSQVFEREVEAARQQEDDGWNFSASILQTLEMMPCGYLNYYYRHSQILEKQLHAERTRGEEVREIEQQLMELYQDPQLKEKPRLLEKRGGAYYSKAAVSLISALANDKREVHIVNTRNQGAVPGLPEAAVVEVAAVIGASGAKPVPVQPMPAEIRGLVQVVKAYEELAAVAGAEGDRRRALQALAAHPLTPSFAAAEGLLEALLEAHREHLPQFFAGGTG